MLWSNAALLVMEQQMGPQAVITMARLTQPKVVVKVLLTLTLAFSGWVARGFGEAVEERARDCCHVLGVRGR